jgi:ribonuclease Y
MIALTAVVVGALVVLMRRLPPSAGPTDPAQQGAAGTLSEAIVDLELERQRAEVARFRDEIERRELRLAEREDRLDAEARQLDDRGHELAEHDDELERRRVALADLDIARRTELERVAGMDTAAARAELQAGLEHEAKLAAAHTVRELEREAQEDGEARARRILTSAIQRLASQQTTESVVSVVSLPSEDMKGRIIGREGRNVRAFEQITGANVIIDNTPDAVLVSCFDPVRRERRTHPPHPHRRGLLA